MIKTYESLTNSVIQVSNTDNWLLDSSEAQIVPVTVLTPCVLPNCPELWG